MSLVLSGKDLIKTAEGHMRSTCRKVNSQARCPAQYSLSRRLTRDLDSQLAPVASDPRSSSVLLKIVTFRIPITHTIYTLITCRNCEEPIKRKTLREVSTTHLPYQRERATYSLFPTLFLLIVAVFVINYGLECFVNLGIAYIYHSAHQLFEYKLVLVFL